MIKKSLGLFLMAFCLTFIVLAAFVTAQNKIGVSTTKESFSARENIAFTVSLYDFQNSPITANVSVTIEDAEKTAKIEKTVSSNKLVDISLGENPRAGSWKITAKYKDDEATDFFTVEMNELARFNIQGDKLIVTNIGNKRYTKTIDIIIGNSLGTKRVDLDIGEEVSFRLIAPDGTYDVRVTDGKTTITKSNVPLTGKVIGILDEKLTTGGSPVTGGIKPEAEADESFYSGLKNKKFIYVFLLVVIGSAVLLAIERNYRKRI